MPSSHQLVNVEGGKTKSRKQPEEADSELARNIHVYKKAMQIEAKNSISKEELVVMKRAGMSCALSVAQARGVSQLLRKESAAAAREGRKINADPAMIGAIILDLEHSQLNTLELGKQKAALDEAVRKDASKSKELQALLDADMLVFGSHMDNDFMDSLQTMMNNVPEARSIE